MSIWYFISSNLISDESKNSETKSKLEFWKRLFTSDIALHTRLKKKTPDSVAHVKFENNHPKSWIWACHKVQFPQHSFKNFTSWDSGINNFADRLLPHFTLLTPNMSIFNKKISLRTAQSFRRLSSSRKLNLFFLKVFEFFSSLNSSLSLGSNKKERTKSIINNDIMTHTRLQTKLITY